MSRREIQQNIRAVALAAMMVLSVMTVIMLPAGAAGQTEVNLSPGSAEVDVSNTTTFDVVVEDVDGGIGAHSTTVTLENASIGEITSVQLAGSPGVQDVSFTSDNSSVSIDTALMDTTDTGAVTIATITVMGTADGTTGLDLSVDALGDEGGTDYTVTGTSDASVTVGADGEAEEGLALRSVGGSIAPALVTESATETHDVGAVFENVSQDGNTDTFAVTFPDAVAGGNLSANSVTVTDLATGDSVSITSSLSQVDGPDQDGIMDTLTFAVSPDGGGTINVAVNISIDVTWPDVDGNATYTILASGEGSATGNVSLASIADVSVTSDTTCINRAVAGPDGEISLSEIQTAINWWAEDTEVPETGGQTISLTRIQNLINAWAEDQPVSCQG